MTREHRLWTVLGLNVALVGGLVAVGVTAHSLGVLAAGGDYVADAAAVGLSLFAIHLGRCPPRARRPSGFPRATTYAALVNGSLLLAVVALVVVEAVRRLVSGPPAVAAEPVVVVGAVAAVVMGAAALVLGDADDDDAGDAANARAVLLDTVADAAAAAGVAVAGAVILATDRFYWLDPAVALAIAIVIGYHALKLVRDVVRLLRAPHPVAAAPPAAAHTEPFRFLALGDSYTICTGASSAPHRWPDMVASRLRESLGRQVELTNLGVRGYTVSDVIAHEMPHLGGARWDLVTILAGVNDQYAGASVDAYRSELVRVYDALARSDSRVVAIAIPDYSYTPVGRQHGGETVASQLRHFNAAARAEAVARGLVWVDIFDVSRAGAGTSGWISGDGLHPGDAQYRAWAEHIWNEVRPTLDPAVLPGS